jgi:hypothetical protein
MGTHNRWRIAIETERILIIARRHTVGGWCERCGQGVEPPATDTAVQMLGIGPEEMERQNHIKFHLRRVKEGLTVCLMFLLRFLQSNGDQERS